MSQSTIGPDILAKIESSRFFSKFTAEDVRVIFAQATVLKASELDNAVVAGEPADRLFVITKGHVGLYSAPSGEGENSHLIDIVGPGETIGLPEILVDASFTYTAKQFDNPVVVALPAKALVDVLSNDVEKTLSLIAGLSIRMRSLVNQISSLKSMNATERVANFLLALAAETVNEKKAGKISAPITYELPFSKKVIASHLGITPESFSRTISKLTAKGINLKGNRVTIDDPGILLES